jgi:hypothetical protein
MMCACLFLTSVREKLCTGSGSCSEKLQWETGPGVGPGTGGGGEESWPQTPGPPLVHI